MKVKPEWFKRFRAESTVHLDEMTLLLNTLGEEPPGSEQVKPNSEKLRQLFIRAHSIKGTAGMLGLMEIASQAAELEALWNEVYYEPTRLSPELQMRATAITADLARLVNALNSAE